MELWPDGHAQRQAANDGLPIGTWNDDMDPGGVIKEMIGDYQAFLEDDTIQPSPFSQKRKKRVESLQNSDLESSRSSKGLRGVTEGSQMDPQAKPRPNCQDKRVKVRIHAIISLD
jgi:hypothetical protein